jgi:hypothetical protein
MGVLDPEYSPPRQAGTSVTKLAMAEVANSAIASFHSYQMDKIRFQMENDILKFKREALAERRRQQSWVSSVNRDRLKESLASERLAFEIDSMKKVAQVQNQASALGMSNAPSIVRDQQRQQLRSELYLQRSQLNKLEQLSVSAYDAQRSNETLYEPAAVDTFGAASQFGITMLEVGKAAYKPFVPTQQGE